MPSKQPLSLQAALRKKKDADFIQTLQLINTNESGPYFERPKLLGLVWGLAAFQRAIAHGGIRAFLDMEEGQSFHETETWCREVGATQAAAYLAATAALYPGGKVPRSDDRRYTIAEKVVKAAGSVIPGPFQALDRKYAGAAEALGRKLRTYVEKHLEEIDLAIDQSFEPSTPTAAQIRAEDRKTLRSLDKALDSLKGVEKADKAKEKKRVAALKKALPRLPKTADPAMITFIDAVIGLSAPQWKEVIARYDKLGKRARDASVEELQTVRFDVQAGRVDGYERFIARVTAAEAQRARVNEALAALPLESKLAGRTISFRAAATFATVQAWGAIQLHEWLIGKDETEKAARTAYAPFKGVAPIPAIPRRSKTAA